MRSPVVLHSCRHASHNARAVCGTDSTMSESVRPPTVVVGTASSVSLPLFPRLFGAHAEHSVVSLWLFRLAGPHSPYRRRDAERSLWAGERLWPLELVPEVLHHADAPRSRLMTAGFHHRRRAGCAWSHFFPRSVGLGPTDCSAKGAFTIAPSMLCQDHAMSSISSYSASPLRHIFTNTPRCFQFRKYWCTELALPNSFGSAFHWQPVRSTYMIASNTVRGFLGFRPPPGRLLYLRPLGRLGFGIRGSTRSHNASDTVHDLCVLMHTSIPQALVKSNNYLRISSKSASW